MEGNDYDVIGRFQTKNDCSRFLKQYASYAEDVLTEEGNYSYRISMNTSLI